MKIAVLVPVYNAARYLPACLDSLLAARDVLLRETDSTLDIYCRDDGSTDDSRKILVEYAAKHPCLKVSSQANAGVSATRNALLDSLSEDVEAFAFCDSDDYVRPEIYAKLVDALVRTQADIAQCGRILEDHESEAEIDHETVVDDTSVYWLKRTAPWMWINVINKLYSRKVVGSVRFRKGLAFEEDLFFNAEAHALVRRTVLLPENFCIYRVNPESVTQKLNHRRYFESTALRIRLSLEVFVQTNRVPTTLRAEYLKELSKDAYRMVIRKNLKKNADPSLRRTLFNEAGDALAALQREFAFEPTGLNLLQNFIWRACLAHRYTLARFLVFLT